MTSDYGWKTPSGNSVVIAAANFNGLVNNNLTLGNAVTVGANPPQTTGLQMTARFGVAPASAAVIGKAWLIVALDGTNFDTHGSTSNNTANAPARAPDAIFVWPTGTTHVGAPDYIQSTPINIQRPQFNFKVLYQNTAGQTHEASAANSVLVENPTFDYGS